MKMYLDQDLFQNIHIYHVSQQFRIYPMSFALNRP